MVKFILVRHGFTTFNKEKRCQGQYDSPLDEIGIKQATHTAEHIVKAYHIDAIYASDLSRTRDTAAPIAKRLELPVHTSKALRELNNGTWENRLISDIKLEEPEAFARKEASLGTFHFPNGECFRDLYNRASLCLSELAKRHDGETVLVVTHGGVIRVLAAVWKGIPIEQVQLLPDPKNTSITVAEYENGKMKLLSFNDVSHLPSELQ